MPPQTSSRILFPSHTFSDDRMSDISNDTLIVNDSTTSGNNQDQVEDHRSEIQHHNSGGGFLSFWNAFLLKIGFVGGGGEDARGIGKRKLFIAAAYTIIILSSASIWRRKNRLL